MSGINIHDIDREDDFANLSGADVARMGQLPGRGEAKDLPLPDGVRPPGPVADAFYWSDADIIGIRGPVGSGKTTTHLKSRLRRAMMMPRSQIDGVRYYKVVIARETYRQLWSTTIPSWWETYPKGLGKWSGGRGDPVTHHIQFEDDFGTIDFVAEFMAFGSSVSEIEANIRGVQTTDLALEEADTVNVAVLTKGIGRIDRYPAPDNFKGLPEGAGAYGQISCSYNSCDEDAWPVRVIEGQSDLGDAEAARARQELENDGIEIKFFRQPGFDEPSTENLHNLSPKYYPRQIAAMKAEGRGNDIDRLVYNRLGFVRVGEPVFKDHFTPAIHRADPSWQLAVPGHPLRIGLDQGYFGAAVIGQFFEPFEWRILGELWFKDGSFAPQFGTKLRELLDGRFSGYRIEEAWCDMAGTAKESLEDVTWASQVSAAARIEIQPQELGGNRVEPRLAVWRAAMDFNLLGRQGLIIHPSCKLLLRGLANDYVWAKEAEDSTNRGRVPKKKGVRAADVIDAGGYMMLGESQPDGTPKTAALLGHNGGPALDDMVEDTSAGDPVGEYDFNPMEGW